VRTSRLANNDEAKPSGCSNSFSTTAWSQQGQLGPFRWIPQTAHPPLYTTSDENRESIEATLRKRGQKQQVLERSARQYEMFFDHKPNCLSEARCSTSVSSTTMSILERDNDVRLINTSSNNTAQRKETKQDKSPRTKRGGLEVRA
jgi:hypothetical protein